MKQLTHPAREQITLPGVLHALSDPIRLGVVRALAGCGGEQACGAFPVPIAKSTLSHHMRVLREAGLIQVRAEGTQHLTSLRRADLEARFPGLLAAVLRAAEALCPNGQDDGGARQTSDCRTTSGAGRTDEEA